MTTPNDEIIVAPTEADAVRHAADAVVAILNARCAATAGPVSLTLAGGSTPARLYRLLTHPEYRNRMDWRRILFWFGDERTVRPNHPDSNYRMARETLLDPLAISPRAVFRMPGEADDLPAAAAAYEAQLRQQVPAERGLPVAADPRSVPRLDLVLLGMGADGHTASLFPGTKALGEQDALVAANDVPSQQTTRLTMTYPVLRAARRIVFFVTGAGKAEALGRVLGSAPEVRATPAAGLRARCMTPESPGPPGGPHEQAPAPRVSWILDADAARLVHTASGT